MLIRPETSGDHDAIFHVNAKAFGREDEARLVDALRKSPAFIPELSLVACLPQQAPAAMGLGPIGSENMLADHTGGIVVAYILFTRMVIKASGGSHSALALAPLAVMPSHQKSGLGTALVRHGLAESTRLGHHIVIVLGHPEYYPKFGFVPASRFGIRAPFDVRPEAFMALELQPDALLHVRGEAEYASPFMAV